MPKLHQPALPSGPPKKKQPGFKSAAERRNKIIKEEIKKHGLKRAAPVPFPTTRDVMDAFCLHHWADCHPCGEWYSPVYNVLNEGSLIFAPKFFQPALEATVWPSGSVGVIQIIGPWKYNGQHGQKVKFHLTLSISRQDVTAAQTPCSDRVTIRHENHILKATKNKDRMTEMLQLIYKAWESLSIARLPESL